MIRTRIRSQTSLMPKGSEPRVKPETLWKLMEARCTLLTAAVGGARIPFMLAATWSFIWFSVVFVNMHGYGESWAKRYAELQLTATRWHASISRVDPDFFELMMGRPGSASPAPKAGASAPSTAASAYTALSASAPTFQASAATMPPVSALGQAADTVDPPKPKYKNHTCTDAEMTKPEVDLEARFSSFCAYAYPMNLNDYEAPRARVSVGPVMGRADSTSAPTMASAFKSSDVCLKRTALALCEQSIATTYQTVWNHELDEWYLELPGLPVKLHASDLGTVGQVGLLLLAIWGYYAFRRENHAVQQFVTFRYPDFAGINGKVRLLFTREYLLVPVDERMSAEHLDFAYSAVSQRFLFLIPSDWPMALRAVTTALVALPVMVGAYNLVTDYSTRGDLVELFPKEEFHFLARMLFSLIVLSFVSVFTLGSWLYMQYTGRLLQCWDIAAKSIWSKDWDERTDDAAVAVRVNIEERTAERVLKSRGRPSVSKSSGSALRRLHVFRQKTLCKRSIPDSVRPPTVEP